MTDNHPLFTQWMVAPQAQNIVHLKFCIQSQFSTKVNLTPGDWSGLGQSILVYLCIMMMMMNDDMAVLMDDDKLSEEEKEEN